MVKDTAPTGDEQELRSLKLDLIDRLSDYDISVKALYGYEQEIEALLQYPSNERISRVNQLVQKIVNQNNK